MEKKGINLNELKEALEKGDVFEGNDTLNKILKKSEGIDKLPDYQKKEILEERKIRVDQQWEENKDEIIADVKKDNEERMEKREENEKNEMVLAKIQFLENEVKIHEELAENIQHELDMNQKKIDDINAQIKVLRKDIKE